MSKHSPGPWIWNNSEPYRAAVLVAGDGTEVCDFGGGIKYEESAGTEPNEADARLIAAAPEMLELLREIEADFTNSDRRAEARALIKRIDGE